MSRRECKDWLESFLEYSKDSETPFKMLYWSGVSALGGALRRNVWLDRGRYTLYPNFYILFVAKPGIVQKTTTIEYATKLLRSVEGINFAPKSCTWEYLITLMDTLHVQDGNVINLTQQVERTTAISVIAGEFGLFFDPENVGMVNALTDLWDCPTLFDKGTKTSGKDFLEKPCLNLIGATTPSWVRENFNRYSREGGFVSRTIFIHADAKRQYVSKPVKGPETLRLKLIRDLEYISQLRGEVIIEPDAEKFLEAWYIPHAQRLEKGLVDATGFTDRKQAHILKLALVIAVSRRDDLRITLADMQEALQRVDEVEGDFAKAFEVVDERPELRPYHEITEYLKKHPNGVRQKMLFSLFASKYTHREITSALSSLMATGQVTCHQTSTEILWSYIPNDPNTLTQEAAQATG